MDEDDGFFCETWLIRGYIRGVAHYWTEDDEWSRDEEDAILHTPFKDSDMVLYKARLLAEIPKNKRIQRMSVIPGPELLVGPVKIERYEH